MATMCAACNDPLTVSIEPASDDESDMLNGTASASAQTVPDDVHLLACEHHFHWSQCLVDHAYTVNNCPACAAIITTTDPSDPSKQKIFVNLVNEGGQQECIDVLPELNEESYLKAYPEERRARAFIEFCRQGDLEAVFSVLQDGHKHDELEADVLRYQDQLAELQSTLQAAVIGGNPDVAWLLLFLASDVPLENFPSHLLQQAQLMGLTRDDNIGKIDVRSLQDLQGHDAAHIAAGLQGVWTSWTGTGRLSLKHREM